mmetsp:Transcript_16850/g.30040  ORF Transcript_16850/g.30040 Transcript_16850/m.30040 type:complete len:261 (+) Transcript_16850:270-1052(+)
MGPCSSTRPTCAHRASISPTRSCDLRPTSPPLWLSVVSHGTNFCSARRDASQRRRRSSIDRSVPMPLTACRVSRISWPKSRMRELELSIATICHRSCPDFRRSNNKGDTSGMVSSLKAALSCIVVLSKSAAADISLLRFKAAIAPRTSPFAQNPFTTCRVDNLVDTIACIFACLPNISANVSSSVMSAASITAGAMLAGRKASRSSPWGWGPTGSGAGAEAGAEVAAGEALACCGADFMREVDAEALVEAGSRSGVALRC